MKSLALLGLTFTLGAAEPQILTKQQLLRLEEAVKNIDASQFKLATGTELPRASKIPVIAESAMIQKYAEQRLQRNGISPDIPSDKSDADYHLELRTYTSPSENPEKKGVYHVVCEVHFRRSALFIVDGNLFRHQGFVSTYTTYGGGEYRASVDAERALKEAIREGIDEMSLVIHKTFQ